MLHVPNRLIENITSIHRKFGWQIKHTDTFLKCHEVSCIDIFEFFTSYKTAQSQVVVPAPFQSSLHLRNGFEKSSHDNQKLLRKWAGKIHVGLLIFRDTEWNLIDSNSSIRNQYLVAQKREFEGRLTQCELTYLILILFVTD